MALDGMFDAVSRELWKLSTGDAQAAASFPVHPYARISAGDPHEKELRLLAHVLSTAHAGDARSVCDAIEGFGCSLLAPSGQWLKIAGGAKAGVLVQVVLNAPQGKDGATWVLE